MFVSNIPVTLLWSGGRLYGDVSLLAAPEGVILVSWASCVISFVCIWGKLDLAVQPVTRVPLGWRPFRFSESPYNSDDGAMCAGRIAMRSAQSHSDFSLCVVPFLRSFCILLLFYVMFVYFMLSMSDNSSCCYCYLLTLPDVKLFLSYLISSHLLLSYGIENSWPRNQKMHDGIIIWCTNIYRRQIFNNLFIYIWIVMLQSWYHRYNI